MSTPTQALSKPAPSNSVLTCIGSDIWKEEVRKVIPKEIALEAMIRVARSTASDYKFKDCDPRSFLLALLKCGRAGLYPDGREAHLIPMGREVIAVFDVKGICALARRAGILVTPKVVFSQDEFTVEEDDGTGKTRIVHRVDYREPRGTIQAVYSRAVMPDGQVDYEIMSSDEVEKVRQHYSKAKDSTPWKNSWGEMAKKTVIKRHSKRWDMSPEIRQALNSDDDAPPPLGEVKVSSPIFESKMAQELPAPVQTTPEPSKPQGGAAAPKDSPLSAVREKLKSRNMAESEVVKFLIDIGFVDQGVDALESVALTRPEALEMVLNQFDDIVERINAEAA